MIYNHVFIIIVKWEIIRKISAPAARRTDQWRSSGRIRWICESWEISSSPLFSCRPWRSSEWYMKLIWGWYIPWWSESWSELYTTKNSEQICDVIRGSDPMIHYSNASGRSKQLIQYLNRLYFIRSWPGDYVMRKIFWCCSMKVLWSVNAAAWSC